MAFKFSGFPQTVLDHAALITSVARSVFIHKGSGDRSEGEVQVLEITAWTRGTLCPDDIMCRDYYAEFRDIDPDLGPRVTTTSREEARRWAHILFQGGPIPPPVFPRATKADANA